MNTHENMAPVSKDDPLMIAWETYKATPAYGNNLAWATHFSIQGSQNGSLSIKHPHTEGSLWGAFVEGFNAGQATRKSENV